MLFLLAFAVVVQTLPEIANALLQWAFGYVREGEGVKADGFVVARAIFQCAAFSQCPNNMKPG